ncbi:MAG: hypothetical protein ACI9CB_000617 [Rhodothermales bacterium]|jgi:hypothetical protein
MQGKEKGSSSSAFLYLECCGYLNESYRFCGSRACWTNAKDSLCNKSGSFGASAMVFYASLFVFSIAVSAVFVWFYRSIFEMGKVTYQSIFPSTRQKYHQNRPESVSSASSAGKTSWGWSSARRAIPVTPSINQTAIVSPWGWKGNNYNDASKRSRNMVANSISQHAQQRKGKDDTVVGWPYREEKMGINGNEYSVVQKKKVKRTNIGGVSKPWGW